MRMIDGLDRRNAGRVYFDIWCRAFDDYVVEVRDEYEAAYSSGYEGQRAIRTWRERVSVLDNLGFVRTKKAPHGSYRYILVLDPHKVVENLYNKKKISDEEWLALRALLLSIGAIRR
jgi:hypothetical protein